MSDSPFRRPLPALVMPVSASVPGGAVVVPEAIAPSVGLHVWPRLELPRGAAIVYALLVLRPPEAPGRPVRSEAVYVGRTRDLSRRLGYHQRRAAQAARGEVNKQAPLPVWDDCVYWIEEAEWAPWLETALIKRLMPLGNSQSKFGAMSYKEVQALERWGMKAD